ncbi:nuclear transport factor 2 family protein [Sanyastnella coralliicola]|uniref:nuclear transport factor 2 family protein n=1 Tax=Sanyastnella coralliicola TaxID=3069118 RepID=UPI0027B9EFC2|nr:nuclear transport factor 2 family protein [Longitalea sp. SCSIO 12813]
MKSVMMLLMFAFAASSTIAQNDEKDIKQTIQQFAKAGDANDAAVLDEVLDANYRVVMNQLFGSDGVSVVPREVYMKKIESKEWGGDDRKVTIHSVHINGKSAVAKVTMEGKKMTFVSVLSLVQNKDGEWKLISDTPTIM